MSISIVKNYPLDKLNTFNISANAKFFYEFKTLESLKEILNHKLLKTEKSFVLGGGSNILISNDFDGVVLKNSIRGIHITKENTHHTEVEVGSGENWHEFVLWCVKKNLSNKYVYYFTCTNSFYEQVGLNTRTSAQPKLALVRLKQIRLAIPPFNIQQSLAEECDKLSDDTEHLESIYQRKLTCLAELKQSLLQKAFSGELTANDTAINEEAVA